MTVTRLLRVNLLLIMVGLVILAAWLRLAGGAGVLTGIARARTPYLAAMAALTIVCLALRFLRWQFLMRHAGVRLAVRPSLMIYLASLIGTATPAYLGEAVRSAFLRRRLDVSPRISLFVLVVERLFDVAALAVIAALSASTWWARAAFAGGLVATGVAGLVACIAARAFGTPEPAVRAMRRPDILFDGLALSCAAWLPPSLIIGLAAASVGTGVGILDGIHVFSSSVLIGGLTLMPAGIGSTGSLVVLQLVRLGVNLPDAIASMALLRLSTSGIAFGLGAACLVALIRERRQLSRGDSAAEHFDEIAVEYGNQFKPHIWNHLLERKVSFIVDALPPAVRSGHGLDLGCGLGQQCLAMRARGLRVFGMDVAQQLVAHARRDGVSAAAGSAMSLPFRTESLDFVYAVGVLHHLPNRRAQRAACDEILRVLKDGGRLIIHETNTRNPLFRLYMGYVFPLLKKIDEGTEWWIEPWRWRTLPGLRVVEMRYFTFMPDFIPGWLLRPFRMLDGWLEASPLRSYAVHYMVVLERDPSWQGAVTPAEEARLAVIAPQPVPAKAAWQ